MFASIHSALRSSALPALRAFSTSAAAPARVTMKDIGTRAFERVVSFREESVGLQGIVAIHSTKLGPSLGGLRIFPYPNFASALVDVERLAEGMSYKSALARTGLGGGKAVIIARPEDVTPEMLKTFAVVVNQLNGAYITAEDVGTTPKDMAFLGQHTPYVTGLPHAKSSGNPSPFTAYGVFRAIQATCQELHRSDSVEGKTVAIQGVGSVGSSLAEHLFWHGARLIVADANPERAAAVAKKYGATVCPPDEIHKQKCDIFAPCALGATVNAKTIPEMRCDIVAGAANNQLEKLADALLLQKSGILHAVDFVANSAGVTNIEQELRCNGYNPLDARNKVTNVYGNTRSVFALAKQNGTTTNDAAIALAKHRIETGDGKRTEAPRFHHWSGPLPTAPTV